MGFFSFLNNMDISNNDMQLIKALVEWWWDNTNVFHFQFRQMKLTPTHITMITRFYCTGELVEFSHDLTSSKDSIKASLGLLTPLENYRGMYIWYLIDHFFRQLRHLHMFTADQKTQAATLIILASTILINKRDSIKFGIFMINKCLILFDA